jgi:hypothetical protein
MSVLVGWAHLSGTAVSLVGGDPGGTHVSQQFGGKLFFLMIEIVSYIGFDSLKTLCRSSLPLDSKFVSIVCRSRMVSTRDNEIYTGSSLRGVIPYVQC